MTALLGRDEPEPVTIEGINRRSRFLITCDHAAKRIPRSLENLGLHRRELERHIARDIGAAEVARQVSQQLDATAVLQNYSRLVIDCNRPETSDQLIPRVSEETEIPGNLGLSDEARRERRDAIFAPYHSMISHLLDDRRSAQQATVYVAIHSFTPVYRGTQRPWHIGILYGEDPRTAAPMLHALNSDAAVCVGDNEPYRIDHNDYGIPVHGDARGLPNVLIELRQDLISSPEGQRIWAERLVRLLGAAVAELPP